MKNSIKVLLAVLLISFSSCEENELAPPPDELELVEFISMETDAGNFLFEEDINIFNSYIKGPRQDQLSLVLNNEDQLSAQIYMFDTELLLSDFPLEVPLNNVSYGEVQLRDFRSDADPTWGPEDDDNYVGLTSESVRITIIDYSNGVIKGTFRGTIRTKTGKSITINTGEFQVIIEEKEGA